MSSYRIFIPTRDSASWSPVFLKAFRALGAEPLYVVDSRSTDGTLELLKSMGAETIVVTPRGDFAEAGMVEAGVKAVGTEWALRIDDDELPSAALLRWVEQIGIGSLRPGWHISRRELFRRDGEVFYSRRPTAYGHPGRPDFLAGQSRLTRVKGLEFVEQVHTSGLSNLKYYGFAPQECFFVHCVDLLKSPAERLEKIRRYEKILPGSTWRVADEYLPEIFDFAHLKPDQNGLAEFSGLVAALPRPDEAPPDLTVQERELAMAATRKLTAEIAQKRLDVGGAYDGTYDIEWIKSVPPWLRRPLAGVLRNAHSLTGKKNTRLAADALWDFGKT